MMLSFNASARDVYDHAYEHRPPGYLVVVVGKRTDKRLSRVGGASGESGSGRAR